MTRRRAALAVLLLPSVLCMHPLHFPHYRSHDGSPIAVPCLWADPESGSTWDLRGLTMPGAAYVFRDQVRGG